MRKIISSILLLLFCPIIIFFGVLIIIDDGFPVFFRQKRVGANNTYFWIYKLRTMKKNIPNVASDKLKNDFSVFTRLGPLLRTLSIDELPQLINILKGEMNFIGPRPALFNQYDLIKLRNKNRVSQLVPGVTGWAQVNGRDKLSIKEKVALDTYYLTEKSFFLNVKILLMTLIKVLKKENVLH
jgi:O-antigen biosynthesis protein WbqP